MNETFQELVASRRSIREFLPDPVPQEVLDRCVDAARLAPSTSNIQPWEFVILRSPEARAEGNTVCFHQRGTATAPLLVAVVAHMDTWQRTSQFILETLKERGILRKSQITYWGAHVPLIYTWGPLGLFGLLKKAFCRLGSLFRPTHNLMDRGDVRAMIHKSTALGAATFMLALRAEGFDACPMEGFDPWRAKRLLGLGRRAEVCMFLAVGKRAPKGIWWERILVPREWSTREL
jgi:nitroreductase